MDFLQFEEQIEQDLAQIHETPWNVLKLKLIKSSADRIREHIPNNQQTSYILQIKSNIPNILISAGDDTIDPKLLEWAYFQVQTELSVDDHKRIVSSIAKRYFRLGAFDKLTRFLSQAVSMEEVFPEPEHISPGHFLSKYADILPDYILDALQDVSEIEYSSASDSVKGLFVVKSGNVSAGVISKICIEKAVVSKKLGLDQVRIATHLVDETDIFAEQTKSVCFYLHKRFKHSVDTHIRLEYSLDQPSSILIGSSAGLALTILGELGLSLFRQNKAIQKRIFTDIAVTGSIDHDGKILPVSNESLMEKLEAAFYGGISTVVVSEDQVKLAKSLIGTLQRAFPARELKIMGLSSVSEFFTKREIVHHQRRRISSRIHQFVKEYANSVTYLIFGFILLLGLGFWFGMVKHPEPDSLLSKYGEIIVYNKYNFELFRVRNRSTNNYIIHSPREAIIADIDLDNRLEILIGNPRNAGNGFESALVCYNNVGAVNWVYEIRSRTVFGDNTYLGTYSIGWVICEDLNNDGEKEIVVTAAHLNFPQVIYILNAEGHKIAEYWNSGHWTGFTVDEVYENNDTKEIIAVGTDNESNQGILVVLDPFEMEGASHQQELYYQKKNAKPGIEIYRIRFPKTHFTSKLYGDLAREISINNGIIELELTCTIASRDET
ncbi:MAG: hypothetical protein ACE5D7_07500, partial [Fidelibacterota bacterium]